MPGPIPVTPRECLTRWPGGQLKTGADPVWGPRAADLARWMTLMHARIERNHTRLTSLARAIGVSRSTLDRTLNGEVWPTFHLLNDLAEEMHYRGIWSEYGKARQRKA